MNVLRLYTWTVKTCLTIHMVHYTWPNHAPQIPDPTDQGETLHLSVFLHSTLEGLALQSVSITARIPSFFFLLWSVQVETDSPGQVFRDQEGPSLSDSYSKNSHFLYVYIHSEDSVSFQKHA